MIDITLPDPSYCIATEPDKKGLPLNVRLDIDLVAKFILENFKIITIEETQEILVYDNGVYKSGGERLIEQVLETTFGGFKSDKNIGKILLDTWTIAEIIAKIKRKSSVKVKFDPDKNIINMANGLFDINKQILLPHDPDYPSLVQIPVSWPAGA